MSIMSFLYSKALASSRSVTLPSRILIPEKRVNEQRHEKTNNVV